MHPVGLGLGLLVVGGLLLGVMLVPGPETPEGPIRWEHRFTTGETRIWVLEAPEGASWGDVEPRTRDGVPIPYRVEGGDDRMDPGEGMQLFGSADRHVNATVLYQGEPVYRLTWKGVAT